MDRTARTKRLMPWYIGIVIVLAAIIFIGYEMFYGGACPAPTAVELIVLIVIPVVYLVLMYLTLVSQD